MTLLLIPAILFLLYIAIGLCLGAKHGDELVVVALEERERLDALVRIQEPHIIERGR
jgi:hypothetical protein